ncbi:MAG: hypothetical protein SFV15_07380 [Polyangiaceae bacterium]|nr:hypothetical protein [Polyangiaceae bacterium]
MSEPDAKASYVSEMLRHRYNVLGAFGAALASGLLAFQTDLGVALLPLIAYATTASVAALFIPYGAGFRARVDARRQRERRQRMRAYLLEEITRRNHSGAQWGAYQRMCQRIDSLRKVAENSSTALTFADVERLEDATLDFLGLWMALLAMEERERAFNAEAVAYKLREIEAQLQAPLGVEERRRLEQAKQDFEGVLERRTHTRSRQASAEASMLALADTFEEVYQAVMTNPSSTEVSRQLQEAVDRVRLQGQVSEAFDEDLAKFIPEMRARSGQQVKVMGS